MEQILLLVDTAFQSIKDRLEQVKMRPSGFDCLRLCLAVAVIAIHTVMACYGPDSREMLALWNSPLRPMLLFVVPSFFALSGFLVAASLLRNSIASFLTLRGLRIFPALACEVLISALIIGPAFTVYSLREYFSNERFRAYFLNMVGSVHLDLPGVFLTNPFSNTLNFQLWTIPYELECYIIIAFLAIVGVTGRPRVFALIILTLVAVLAAPAIYFNYSFGLPAPVPGRMCVVAFLCGVLLYLWQGKVPFSFLLFLFAVVLSWVLLSSLQMLYVAAIPVSYVTVWLGLQNPTRNFIIAGSDYSYGLYLYGAPIQQALVDFLPQYRIWYANLVLTLIVAGLAAYLSWNLIEARVLGAKQQAVRLVDSIFDWVVGQIFGRARRQLNNRP